jgi:hypothetical protein
MSRVKATTAAPMSLAGLLRNTAGRQLNGTAAAVTDSFTHHFYLLWLSYIFYHKKCRVYSGRIKVY